MTVCVLGMGYTGYVGLVTLIEKWEMFFLSLGLVHVIGYYALSANGIAL